MTDASHDDRPPPILPPGVNDARGRDPRAPLADELAALLATRDGQRTARLLQLLGTLADPAAPGASMPGASMPGASMPGAAAPDASPRPIRIWQPDGPGRWRRPPVGPFGDHYAAARTLRAQPGARRVAFFGESAAAGYLYAPHLTPARVLGEALTLGDDGARAWQVIDLARTNERLGSLLSAVDEARALAPDVLVVWTGNNVALLEARAVSPYAARERDRQAYGLALRRGGLHGVRQRAQRHLAARLDDFLDRLMALADGRPVVLAVPAVNGLDWPAVQPAPSLPSPLRARWCALQARVRALWRPADSIDGEAPRAAAVFDADAFAEALDAWTALDARADGAAGRALSPEPMWWRARLAARRGAMTAAVEAADRAVAHDDLTAATFLPAPRSTPQVQGHLRRGGHARGFHVVDLPAVFAAATDGRPPDRALFLDYCHLTRRGMRLAMAAVAAAVRRIGRADASAPDPAAPDGAPRDVGQLPPAWVLPDAVATARIGAAVHTAHRGPEPTVVRSLLRHWCRRALDAAPSARATLVDLRAARVGTSSAPAVLTAAQRRDRHRVAPLLLQHGWRWDGDPFGGGAFDLDVLAAAAAAGAPGGTAALVDALLRHHGLAPRAPDRSTRDLLRTPFRQHPLAVPLVDALHADRQQPRRAVVPSMTAAFTALLPLAAPARIRLTWIARAAVDQAASTLSVRLRPWQGIDARHADDAPVDGGSDIVVGTWPLRRGWTRTTQRLPDDGAAQPSLAAGLYRVELRCCCCAAAAAAAAPPDAVVPRPLAASIATFEAGVAGWPHAPWFELAALRVGIG
ncbi:MAG: hypothetical protein AAF772_04260 [Acidobacteriota bacterium]